MPVIIIHYQKRSLRVQDFEFASYNILIVDYGSILQLHHTSLYIIEIHHFCNTSINFLKVQVIMQIVQQINKKCEDSIPYYKNAEELALQTYNQGLNSLNNLYGLSLNKFNQVSRSSIQFRKDIVWMFSQATDDLLEIMEKKFEIDTSSTKEKEKMKRLQRIYFELKEKKLLTYVHKLVEYNETLIAKGKCYHQRYIVPLYITLKATVLASREMFMEAFAERVSKLKMSYSCSKDSITMFWSGQFKEQKILQKVKEHLGSLKQFTINFVQRGLEIKISKQDLLENYHHVMTKLSEILKDASSKSIEQWTQTKIKTKDLYQSVLSRIRAKQSQIRKSMIPKFTEQIKEIVQETTVMRKEVQEPFLTEPASIPNEQKSEDKKEGQERESQEDNESEDKE